jgi:hypothetical protein
MMPAVGLHPRSSAADAHADPGSDARELIGKADFLVADCSIEYEGELRFDALHSRVPVHLLVVGAYCRHTQLFG